MIDEEKAKEAVRLFLEAIGEDGRREGLLETPDRISRMLGELFYGYEEDVGTHLSRQFTVENNELVLEKEIPFYSVCEHHLLPFFGMAHIAYIPNGKVVGLSKLSRTVEVFARRAQIQERMTVQIADALETYLKPAGVMVVVEAEHLCMSMRGVKKPGSKTITTVTRGVLETDYNRQSMILDRIRWK